MLETMKMMQDKYGLCSKKIIDEMIEFFKMYSTFIPIKDNLYKIEYEHIIPNVFEEGACDGLFYGSLAYLTENRCNDIYHNYSKIDCNGNELHIVEFDDTYKPFKCYTSLLRRNTGLICLALQDLKIFKDFLFMHELGHIVRIMNGFPSEMAHDLLEKEEAIANVFAIKAYGKYLGLPDQQIISNYHKPAIKAQILKNLNCPDYDINEVNKYQLEMDKNIELGLEFFNQKI